MKRFVWFVPLALAACLSVNGFSNSPARADHGDHGDHGKQGQKNKEVRLRISLMGDDIDGVTPEGQAEFRARDRERELKVEADDVNLPDGTVLSVQVNGMPIGRIRLEEGQGELELNTENRRRVPNIQTGDVLTLVDEDGDIILSGTF